MPETFPGDPDVSGDILSFGLQSPKGPDFVGCGSQHGLAMLSEK